MKSLIEFINEVENSTKIKATDQWMQTAYKEFNEKYFNNELPTRVELKVIKTLSTDTWLGQQGEHWPFYVSHDHMENGMYRMYKKRKGMHTVKRGRGYAWEDTVDENYPVKSIVELHPFINISSQYVFEPNELEDTMIHEMVHLWTYKDGLAPLQAHGKEFKKKCKEIRELAKSKYGKTYSLTTRATDNSQYELSDETKQQLQSAIISNEKKAGGTWLLYIKLDDDVLKTKYPYTDRFLFVSKNMLPQLVKDITGYHNRHPKEGKILKLIAADNLYVDICNIYGKFRTSRKYNYWECNQYPEVLKKLEKANQVNMLKENFENIETMIDEDKKPYIKPTITVIEIPADINLSNINIEDIINGIKPKDDGEQTGCKETDNNIITVE